MLCDGRAALASRRASTQQPARQHFKLRGVDYVGYLSFSLPGEPRPDGARLGPSLPRCATGSVAELLEEGHIDLAIEVMHDLRLSGPLQYFAARAVRGHRHATHPEIRCEWPAPRRPQRSISISIAIAASLHSFIGGTNWKRAIRARGDEFAAAVVVFSAPHFFSIAERGRLGMIATFPALARRIRADARSQRLPAPIELAPISLGMIWHRRNDSELGPGLFRQQ